MAASPEIKRKLKLIRKNLRASLLNYQLFFKKVKRNKPTGLDKQFRREHEKVFKKINCMDCANCCRNAYPVFEKPDIHRIARHFKITPKEFIRKYLVRDRNYGYLTKNTPCPFLLQDNKCGIYEIRPTGCKTYPPARMRLTKDQLEVLENNIDVCPAIYDMVSNIMVFFKSEFSEKKA